MLLRPPHLPGSLRRASTVAKKPLKPAAIPLHPPRLPELAALPEATSRLVFASLPYGSPAHHLFPSASSSHHAHSTPLFTLRCFPSPRRSPPSAPRTRSPLLELPSPPPALEHTTSDDALQPFLSSPSQLRQRLLQLKQGRKPWRMELTLLASKKKVHKSAVVRQRCKRRFKEAVRLVVLRGAKKGEGSEGVVISEDWKEEGARKWLMPGYSYVASITLELYRHPMPDLIETMRAALKALKIKASNNKFQQELSQIPEPPADLSLEELAREPPSPSQHAGALDATEGSATS